MSLTSCRNWRWFCSVYVWGVSEKGIQVLKVLLEYISCWFGLDSPALNVTLVESTCFSGHSSGSNLLDKTLISAEHVVPYGIALLWKIYFRRALTDAEGFLHYVWMVKSRERHLQLILFGFCSSKPSTQAVRLGPCGLSVCSFCCPLLCYNI